MNNKKVILAILDGFGINMSTPTENAILQANAPTLQGLFAQPYTRLDASGLAVGIPEWQMWNSEVGHMTIGAGRTVLQWTMRIDASLSSGVFRTLPEYDATIAHLSRTRWSLHLMTLCGSGWVHASQVHLEKILDSIPSSTRVFLHLFTDGRDLPPKSALGIISDIEDRILVWHPNVMIASLAGRYFAMDRDNNYARTEWVYRMLTGQGLSTDQSAREVIESMYMDNKTDEFIEPVLLDEDWIIKNWDAIWFLNFRSDRARMLTEAFYEHEFIHFARESFKDLYFVSMVPYYQGYSGASFFRDEPLTDTLWEVISRSGIRQMRIAETEKFAHVTKFFDGGRFEPFALSDHILIPSHKVATYDLDPAMSADTITDTITRDGEVYPVIIVNYANGDMVGHTGILSAAVQAVETLDRNIARLIEFARIYEYDILLTADHGNCEEMGTTKEPKTSHTTNLVPCWHIVDGRVIPLQSDSGTLANLAPTILSILDIEKPACMIECLA